MSALHELDWHDVRDHYDNRVEIHTELLRLYQLNDVVPFVNLLLGISDPAGNYSADDHKLGPRIISNNSNVRNRIIALAGEFISLSSASAVPKIIQNAALSYLKIGVGSEASCMLNPKVCWVANTRTIWTHLVVKHADNFAKADEELKLYRGQDDTSEMAYRIWTAIHAELTTSMVRIAEEGWRLAKAAGVVPGPIRYLWADAIANALYAGHYD